MLRQRLLSANIAIPILVVLTLLGGVWYLVGALVASLWALTEWLTLVERAGRRPFFELGLIVSTAIIVDAHFGGQHTLAVLVVGFALGLVLVALRSEPFDAVDDWSLTLAGVFYCGLLISYYVLLRSLPNGVSWVLIVLLGTFACDSGAFFVGKHLGKRKLSPMMSPGKTWEGAIGGLIASILAYAALTQLAALPINLAQSTLLGGLTGVVCQLGDLAESAFKRSLRAKDASATIPGHGGMLDRIDSLVLSGVLVYYFIELLRVA